MIFFCKKWRNNSSILFLLDHSTFMPRPESCPIRMHSIQLRNHVRNHHFIQLCKLTRTGQSGSANLFQVKSVSWWNLWIRKLCCQFKKIMWNKWRFHNKLDRSLKFYKAYQGKIMGKNSKLYSILSWRQSYKRNLVLKKSKVVLKSLMVLYFIL